MFLADCTRGKSQILIVFILMCLFEEKYFTFFFWKTFILCKRFLNYSKTCQHFCLINGFKRKNAYILGLKSVEIYVAVMGEINLPLIIL